MIACVIAYNEEDLLPGCLDSLQGKVSRIVVVDGRYKDFPGEGGPSTDGTRDIALSYDNVSFIPSPDGAWVNEITKRNAYLVGNEGDWYFVIDADEVLLTPLPRPDQLPPGALSYQVKLTMRDTKTWMARLFRHRGRMEHRGCLDCLFSDDELISSRQTTPKLASVELLHRQPLRSAERRLHKNAYTHRMYDLEHATRVELGM